MIIRVGTANAMKVAATRKAFAKFFKGAKVEAIDVPSSVSPQPISFGEIVRGARERARKAFRDCDYSVGIEAGIFRAGPASSRPFQITLACVFDGTREALGSGPFYEVPASLVRKIAQADTGSVAIVTKGKVTREAVTRDAVVMALAPFVSPELYSSS
jgi:inosine/xanthosine triphosphatase